MNCHDYQHRWTLYAADQLDRSERIPLDRHLAAPCPECQAELRAARAAVAECWLAIDPAAPGPHLKRRLMARVHGDELSAPPSRHRRVAPLRPRFTVALVHQTIRSAVTRPGIRPGMKFAMAGAAAVALCAAVLWIGVPWSAAGGNQGALALASGAAAVPPGRSGSQTSGDHTAAASAGAMTGGRTPGIAGGTVPLTVVPLRDQVNHGVAAQLLWDRHGHVCYLVAPALAPTAAGYRYHLWFLTRDGRVVMVRSFVVAQPHHGRLKITLPSRLAPTDTPGVIAKATITYGPARGGGPQSPLLTGRFPRPGDGR